MALYGPTAPCPPWQYGVVVGPGPNFHHPSCFLGQDKQIIGGVDRNVLGRTCIPTGEEVAEWAKYPADAWLSNWAMDGGWAPGRSHVVRWGNTGNSRREIPPSFYKAGCNDMYDLCYWPLQVNHQQVKEGMDIMLQLHLDWMVLVRQHAQVIATQIMSAAKSARLLREIERFLDNDLSEMSLNIKRCRKHDAQLHEHVKRQEAKTGKQTFKDFPSNLVLPEGVVVQHDEDAPDEVEAGPDTQTSTVEDPRAKRAKASDSGHTTTASSSSAWRHWN